MSKESDRKKAEELLKKLHAAFPESGFDSEPEAPVEEEPETPASEAQKAPAAEEKKPQAEPAPVEPAEEPKAEEASAPAEEAQKEELPIAKETPAPEEVPEHAEKSAKKEEPAAEKETPKAAAEETKSLVAAPAAILALTEDAPDVTGRNPTDPTTLKEAEAKAEAKAAPSKKARPNTVKIPPRRRSGVNTGAIGQRPAQSAQQPAQPAQPVQKKPAPANQKKMDDISAPRVGAERINAAPKAEEPKKAPVEEPVKEADQASADTAALRAGSTVIVDFDSQASSTVEPIENTEATETVSDPSANKGRRRPKKAPIDDGLDATSVIAKRTGLDESDIALIFELGYENELGRLVGYETLKKLKYEHLRHSRLNSGDYYGQAFGYRGKEYTSALPAERSCRLHARPQTPDHSHCSDGLDFGTALFCGFPRVFCLFARSAYGNFLFVPHRFAPAVFDRHFPDGKAHSCRLARVFEV